MRNLKTEPKLHGGARNLTGQVFGRLTAISPTEKREKSGSIVWLCRCSCGSMTEASQNALSSGNVVSCGCRKRENDKNIYSQLHLVDGTCIEFLERRSRRSDNKTGYTGVSCCKGRFRASITFKGKRHSLGTYDTVEEAARVRERAKDSLHGDFLKEYYRTQATDTAR